MNDADRARAALHALDAGCDRDTWLRAAMGAKAAGLDESDFTDWSRGASNFKGDADCRAVWRSIKPDGGITGATLYAMARAAGWRDESPRMNGHAKPCNGNAPRTRQNGAQRPKLDAATVWASCEPASATHGYIARKLGLPFGLRVVPDSATLTIAGQRVAGWLAVPMFEGDEPASIQFIPPAEGKKLNLPGHPVAGWFTVGGPLAEVVFVAEGLGQCWSAHQATGKPAICCFGAGRMETVARALRERHPAARLVIIADAGKERDAERIARAVGGAWVEMPAGSPANFDLNDFHQQARSLPAVAELLGQAREPEPADAWPGDGAVGEYLRTPAPPVAWYAHERLLAGRGHLLTGIGGSSKTRMLYHLGIGAVLGRLPWDWQIDGTGSAALFLCEDTAATVHRTLAAMRSAMQLSADEIALLSERLRVFGLAGKPSHLLMAAPGGVLTESFRVEALLAEVRRLPQPVAFIGLDPALGLTEGDEMNSAHQRRLGELVDRIGIETGACAVLSTHSAKSLQSADEIGSHSSRGSGAITDAVRGEFALRTMTAAEARQFGIADMAERKAYVQLVGVKGNELPPAAFVPVWLRRGSGGVLYPVALEPQAAAAIGKRETAALDELRKLAATGAPTLKAWRDACTDAGLLTGPTERAREKAMERIRDALLGAGLIERGIGRGVFVPAQAEEPA